MGEDGGELNLPQKALRPERRRQLGAQDLHGHPPLVLEILGEIDRGHAPATDLVQDSVARGQCSPKSLQLIRGDDHTAGPTAESAKIARGGRARRSAAASASRSRR